MIIKSNRHDSEESEASLHHERLGPKGHVQEAQEGADEEGERAEHALRDRRVRHHLQPVRGPARRLARLPQLRPARARAVQAHAGDGAEQEDGEPGVVHPPPHRQGGGPAQEGPQGQPREGDHASHVPVPHREDSAGARIVGVERYGVGA